MILAAPTEPDDNLSRCPSCGADSMGCTVKLGLSGRRCCQHCGHQPSAPSKAAALRRERHLSPRGHDRGTEDSKVDSPVPIPGSDPPAPGHGAPIPLNPTKEITND